MRRTNLITLLSMVILLTVATVLIFFGEKPSVRAGTEKYNNTLQNDNTKEMPVSADKNTETADSTDTDTEPSESDAVNLTENKTPLTDSSEISMDDALFIGDSRTVALSEYSGIEGADFFAEIGMSVYNIYKKSVSVPSVGKVTLKELLNNKKYGKIYIMLGINEIGYKFDKTIAKYSELIKFIQEKQSDAVIIIQANLHVTKSRSDGDKIINNNAINELNAGLAELADGKNIFYIDANAIFDDENGALPADKSEDNVHLYAKYCIQWGEWIVSQTASLIREGRF